MTAILFQTWTSFSQSVILSENTAKKVVKELVESDYCKEENKLLSDQVTILSNQIEQKQEEVDNLDGQIETQQSIILTKDKLLSNDQDIIKDLKKIITRKENTSLIYKIGTGVAIVLGLVVIAQ